MQMKYGKLDLDPVKSPGVLDTATWDKEGLCRLIASRGSAWFGLFDRAAHAEIQEKPFHGIVAAGSVLAREGRLYLLAQVDDGQYVFLSRGSVGSKDLLGKPLAELRSEDDSLLSAYPTDASTIDRYCRTLNPPNAPRALGRRPRLGIGTRMTTRIWPGIFQAMRKGGFAANAIQNSVRELNLLGHLEEGKPPEKNTAFCFGEIESGYTGSTFEGLWVAGTLAALMHEHPLVYGADADHIQLKRSDTGLRQALSVVEAARYYSFFTLDPSDMLDYKALHCTPSGDSLIRAKVPDARLRKELLGWHSRGIRIAGRSYHPDADLIGRLVGKYWDSMQGAEALVSRIKALKGVEPFDLEFAYDENPPEVAVSGSISLDEENLFVMREVQRRGLPFTHIAPNLGVEKGRDYRLPDGHDGLAARLSLAVTMAEELGFMVDVHSADDLSPATRKVIGKAGRGRLHYKISPSLMYLFAECVHDHFPELFRRWWDDALAYAEREAHRGSPIARDCLAALDASPDRSPSPRHELFHQFYFAFPGRRDDEGRFANREILYSLSSEFYADYQSRVAQRLGEIAADVFIT